MNQIMYLCSEKYSKQIKIVLIYTSPSPKPEQIPKKRMKSQYSAVRAAMSIPPQVKILLISIKIQAVVFLIKKGPSGIPIK